MFFLYSIVLPSKTVYICTIKLSHESLQIKLPMPTLHRYPLKINWQDAETKCSSADNLDFVAS